MQAAQLRLHGDLEVPTRFVVPESEEWPEEMCGTELGTAVNMIRTDSRLLRSCATARSGAGSGWRKQAFATAAPQLRFKMEDLNAVLAAGGGRM